MNASEEEIERVNRLHRKTFDKLYHIVEPSHPEGVPERLEKEVLPPGIKEKTPSSASARQSDCLYTAHRDLTRFPAGAENKVPFSRK